MGRPACVCVSHGMATLALVGRVGARQCSWGRTSYTCTSCGPTQNAMLHSGGSAAYSCVDSGIPCAWGGSRSSRGNCLAATQSGRPCVCSCTGISRLPQDSLAVNQRQWQEGARRVILRAEFLFCTCEACAPSSSTARQRQSRAAPSSSLYGRRFLLYNHSSQFSAHQLPGVLKKKLGLVLVPKVSLCTTYGGHPAASSRHEMVVMDSIRWAKLIQK
jgi:hypothetical protein